MKKLLLAIAIVCLLAETATSGGLVTNTNQSASFIRNPASNASLGIDATFYNPAGLAFLEDGFYLSLSNQYITQERNIKSTFPNMNRNEFIGTVTAPIFPTFYAVYKRNNLALSFGLNPVGGGGSAFFEEGLPSFEQQVSVLPGMLSTAGISTTRYAAHTEFDGASIIWGFQLNASYLITENISVSLGLRYLNAQNTYKGFMRHVMINPNQPAFGAIYNGANLWSAPVFFTAAATTLTGWATGANSFFAGLQPIITGGGGATLLANGTAVGLTALQITQIQGLITAAGQSHTGINILQAQTILGAAAPVFTANAGAMSANALLTANKELDAKQTGTGFAPVIGFTYNNRNNLVVAVKYEHKAQITLTNETLVDDVGLYPDGDETPSDMPATITLGVSFKPIDRLTLSGGYNLYFDRSANYGKKIAGVLVDNKEVIDNNFWEASFGVEYSLNDRFLVSAGYLRTQTGVNEFYQSDFSHSLSTNSIGLGGRYKLNENLGINIGFMNTFYEGHVKAFGTFQEEYNRSAMVIALGADFKF